METFTLIIILLAVGTLILADVRKKSGSPVISFLPLVSSVIAIVAILEDTTIGDDSVMIYMIMPLFTFLMSIGLLIGGR